MTAKDLILKHEGLRLKPYHDTVGKLTIGVGRNLDDVGISEDEAMYMLENDIKRCENELREIFENFDELPDNVKIVLTDMIFNLGKNRFFQFKKMIAAIKEGDFKKAAEEAKNSRWCRQVKSRCEEDYNLFIRT
jgi:lysozyme